MENLVENCVTYLEQQYKMFRWEKILLNSNFFGPILFRGAFRRNLFSPHFAKSPGGRVPPTNPPPLGLEGGGVRILSPPPCVPVKPWQRAMLTDPQFAMISLYVLHGNGVNPLPNTGPGVVGKALLGAVWNLIFWLSKKSAKWKMLGEPTF